MIKQQKPTDDKAAPKRERYFEGRGGRKTAVARARLYPKGTGLTINEKSVSEYFSGARDRAVVGAPFELLKIADQVRATVHVTGGGIHAQADAIRNALARAIVEWDAESKKRLRKAGYITRDPRAVERKKYGLKKARRAPQWQKR
jgi:small subunit ribosomal protein S9